MQSALADRIQWPSSAVTTVRRDDQDLAREFRHARGGYEDDDGEAERPRRHLGLEWLFWFLLDVSLIVLPVPLVVTVPPVVDCRYIETNVGFYAGESFTSCASNGIRERWALLDSRIKMLVRQSGR